MAFYDEDGNRVTTTFTNAHEGSSKIETRTTVVKDVPTDSKDHLYSPDITDARARDNLFQDDHLSESNTFDNPQNSEFFQRITVNYGDNVFNVTGLSCCQTGRAVVKGPVTLLCCA